MAPKPKRKPLMKATGKADPELKTSNAKAYAETVSGTKNKKDPKYVDAYNTEMSKQGYKKGGKVSKGKKKK